MDLVILPPVVPNTSVDVIQLAPDIFWSVAGPSQIEAKRIVGLPQQPPSNAGELFAIELLAIEPVLDEAVTVAILDRQPALQLLSHDRSAHGPEHVISCAIAQAQPDLCLELAALS